MNVFDFNEHKRDTWKCDCLIGHLISITNGMKNFLDQLKGIANAKMLGVLHCWRLTLQRTGSNIRDQGIMLQEGK